MSFDLTNRIKIVNPAANIDELYGVYQSVAEANSEIPMELRSIGRTVGVMTEDGVEEFWYKKGIQDNDLIRKTPTEIVDNTIVYPVELFNTSDSISNPPAFDATADNPVGWTEEVPNVGFDTALWKIVAHFNIHGTRIENWRGAILVNGIGQKGGSSFVSFVFKRSHTTPMTPYGGTFENPIPEGWSDGIPPEDDGKAVYSSKRLFSNDSSIPQDEEWSAPQLMVDTVDFDVEWSNLSYDNGHAGTPDFPLNGAVWSNDSTGAKWMATRTIKNGKPNQWDVVRIEGEKGKDGKDAASVFTSTVFVRSDSQPAKPSGGSFASPIPEGWSDGIPPELNGYPVWTSKRIFTSNGLAPQDSDWSVPMLAVDTSTVDFEWSSSDVEDAGTPDAPLNGAIWSNENSVDTVWMAVRTTDNGLVSEWQVTKIRGEDGADGHTGYILELSNDNTSVPATAEGLFTNPTIAFANAKTKATLYFGDSILTTADYGLELTATSGLTYSSSVDNTEVHVTGLTADTGTITFKAYPKLSGGALDTTKLLATSVFSITKVRNTASYHIQSSTDIIKVSSTGTNTPSVVSATILVNSGDTNYPTDKGILAYNILTTDNLYTAGYGTTHTIGEDIDISNINPNALFFEWLYYHEGTGELLDRERIAFVRDGIAGTSVEFRFRVTDTSTIIPSLNKGTPNPPDWTVAQPTIPDGHVLWMTQATKKVDGTLIGEWSNPVIFIGRKGDKGDVGETGAAGAPGIMGTQGVSPRTFEWLAGAQYQIGGGFIDYIYYRGNTADSNDTTRGWYTVKIPSGKTLANYNETALEVTANLTGSPSTTLFQKSPFSDTMTFSTVIAEQANLAGFLFRNRILTSHDTDTMSCNNVASPEYPNLTIDGVRGEIKFLEKMFLNKTGITLKDNCKNDRMLFQFDDTSGVPILRFLDDKGNIVWEAGKDGYQVKVITQGTTQPSWGSNTGFRRITTLANDETLDFTDQNFGTNYATAFNFIKSYITNEQNSPTAVNMLAWESSPAYFTTTAMPKTQAYTAANNYGYANKYDNGDILANENQKEVFYIIKTPVETIPHANIIPDGWYLMEYESGYNGNLMMAEPAESDRQGYWLEKYFTRIVYMKNGLQLRYVKIFVHNNYYN